MNLKLAFWNWRDRSRRYPVVRLSAHLQSAADWLLAAQAGTPDDGLAHSYDLRTGRWNASYPETTGYAIETLYRYAQFSQQPRYAEAARKAADWEIAVQLPEGGVMAGKLDAPKVVPTIFNTGQVLFGWAAAIENETDNDKYKVALTRACDWLVTVMDADGAWRKYPSPFGPAKESSYNTRSAFGLARASQVLQRRDFLEAATRNVAYVAAKAQDNGFLPDNCLEHPERPLTHTIAYSIRGILEVGLAAQEDRFVRLALKMARAVAQVQQPDGAIPGRLDAQWRPTESWVCVTGVCQMALNWLRFSESGVTQEFNDHAVRANRYVMSLQDRIHMNDGIRGGIKGSHPVGGEYMQYRYPNWATKFFMDALLLEAQTVPGAPI